MKNKTMKKPTIPNKLKVGDKIMTVSHGRIFGVTDVKEERHETVILFKGLEPLGTNEISKKIEPNGFIGTYEVFDIYLYNKEVCEKQGFDYIPY